VLQRAKQRWAYEKMKRDADKEKKEETWEGEGEGQEKESEQQVAVTTELAIDEEEKGEDGKDEDKEGEGEEGEGEEDGDDIDEDCGVVPLRDACFHNTISENPETGQGTAEVPGKEDAGAVSDKSEGIDDDDDDDDLFETQPTEDKLDKAERRKARLRVSMQRLEEQIRERERKLAERGVVMSGKGQGRARLESFELYFHR
jgi:hypothetical protein